MQSIPFSQHKMSLARNIAHQTASSFYYRYYTIRRPGRQGLFRLPKKIRGRLLPAGSVFFILSREQSVFLPGRRSSPSAYPHPFRPDSSCVLPKTAIPPERLRVTAFPRGIGDIFAHISFTNRLLRRKHIGICPACHRRKYRSTAGTGLR